MNDGESLLYASHLQQDGSQVILKRKLVEGKDFCILSSGQWNLLKSWYGAGPEVGRKVVTGTGRNQKFIDLYPLQLWLFPNSKSEEKKKKALLVGKTTTVEDFRKMAVGMCMPEDSSELWMVDKEHKPMLLCKDGDKRTLEECDFADFNMFCFSNGEATLNPNGNSSMILLGNGPSQRPHSARDDCGIRGRRAGLNGDISEINTRNGAGYKTQKPAQIAPGHGLIGLQNLGNTCFMNSALQCLSNTDVLAHFFIEARWRTDLNRENVLGMQGKLAEAFAAVMRQLWGDVGAYSVCPHDFKKTVGSFAPQFIGYAQHDSQELLAFLIDGLHEDLNRIYSKPITEIPTGDGTNDEEIASLAWERHRLRNDSFIQDVLFAQYRSELVCPDEMCRNVSVTFDPYNCFTVQLPQAKNIAVTVIIRFLDARRPRRKITFKMAKSGKMEDLKTKLHSIVRVPVQCIILADVCKGYFKSVYSDSKRWVSCPFHCGSKCACKDLRAYLESTFGPACMPSCLPVCMHACMHACLHAFLFVPFQSTQDFIFYF